ncbi:hypothetical protein EDD18DRAFT_1203687 [Armillaria luteobubalina]|uniref:Secreted protein n=1 Tax=Armillaria luteobubalina TaxID=153913 RepID=A0AA39PD82_9AGAR|nr:hypothetical protein EDD18DRAFT_1203687 [Armillaria luteobubalina]
MWYFTVALVLIACSSRFLNSRIFSRSSGRKSENRMPRSYFHRPSMERDEDRDSGQKFLTNSSVSWVLFYDERYL